MRHFLLSQGLLFLLISTQIALADAQHEAEAAVFAAATDSSIDEVLERYKVYVDPITKEKYRIVGYDQLENTILTDNLAVYKITLLYGDPDIPRIYFGCEATIANKNGVLTFSKLIPKKCE